MTDIFRVSYEGLKQSLPAVSFRGQYCSLDLKGWMPIRQKRSGARVVCKNQPNHLGMVLMYMVFGLGAAIGRDKFWLMGCGVVLVMTFGMHLYITIRSMRQQWAAIVDWEKGALMLGEETCAISEVKAVVLSLARNMAHAEFIPGSTADEGEGIHEYVYVVGKNSNGEGFALRGVKASRLGMCGGFAKDLATELKVRLVKFDQCPSGYVIDLIQSQPVT